MIMEVDTQHPVPQLYKLAVYLLFKKYNSILGRMFFFKLKKSYVTWSNRGSGFLNKRDQLKLVLSEMTDFEDSSIYAKF